MPPGFGPDGLAELAHAANATRKAQALRWRAARWRCARTELWRLLERHLPSRAAVAVVGAGNAHDIPLRRLARHGRRVDLIDVDAAQLLRAQQRLLPRRRGHGAVEDVTLGAADAIILAAVSGQAAHIRRAGSAAAGHQRTGGEQYSEERWTWFRV